MNYSKEDWDGYGGKPIIDDLWHCLLCNIINNSNVPKPYHVGPCGDGTIHVEWRWGNNKFIIEIGSNYCNWSHCNGKNTFYNDEKVNVVKAIDILNERFKNWD